MDLSLIKSAMKNNIITFPTPNNSKQMDQIINKSNLDVNKIADLFYQVEKGIMSATDARGQYSKLIQDIINDHHEIVLLDQRITNS
jgi:iron-sulfur cluster repair protein YtfE (RIC family)